VGDEANSKPTMGARTIAVLVTIAFSMIGVLGDYFLKLASAREQPLRTGWFYLGFVLYASTAFGWVFVMKAPEAGDHQRPLLRFPGAASHCHRRCVVPGVTELL
jgi:hypothetical protein